MCDAHDNFNWLMEGRFPKKKKKSKGKKRKFMAITNNKY